jgi:hypothetical protein
MSNMDRKTALEVLKNYQTWIRCDVTIEASPDMPNPTIIGQALDVAIRELERLCQEPPKREYYGQ